MTNCEQHARFRALLAATGLHPRVFMDRLLDLGEARVVEMIRVPEGVRAVV